MGAGVTWEGGKDEKAWKISDEGPHGTGSENWICQLQRILRPQGKKWRDAGDRLKIRKAFGMHILTRTQRPKAQAEGLGNPSRRCTQTQCWEVRGSQGKTS